MSIIFFVFFCSDRNFIKTHFYPLQPSLRIFPQTEKLLQLHRASSYCLQVRIYIFSRTFFICITNVMIKVVLSLAFVFKPLFHTWKTLTIIFLYAFLSAHKFQNFPQIVSSTMGKSNSFMCWWNWNSFSATPWLVS